MRHLLAVGRWDIVGLTRNPDSKAAQALTRAGASAVRGDLLEPDSLAAAFRGAHGVFGVTQPWSHDYKTCDVAGEVRQGKNLVDAARAAGVQHLVLSTVLLPQSGRTGIPHVDSKVEIEEYARERGLPATILRPGSFMDNIGLPFYPVRKGRIRGFVSGDARMPYVATRDIGAVAAAVFDRREEWLGRDVGVVGERISGDEIAATLSRIRGGEPFRYTAAPALLMRLFAPEFFAMRHAFEKYGHPPFPPALEQALADTRTLCPTVTSMEAHLRSRGFATQPLR